MKDFYYYILIFAFQVVFNIFKVFEIKLTYQHKISKLLINTVLINLVSIGSMFFSLERLLLGDWLVIPFYIGGSVIGKWVAMKF
jgi:hypothetical protein